MMLLPWKAKTLLARIGTLVRMKGKSMLQFKDFDRMMHVLKSSKGHIFDIVNLRYSHSEYKEEP